MLSCLISFYDFIPSSLSMFCEQSGPDSLSKSLIHIKSFFRTQNLVVVDVSSLKNPWISFITLFYSCFLEVSLSCHFKKVIYSFHRLMKAKTTKLKLWRDVICLSCNPLHERTQENSSWIPGKARGDEIAFNLDILVFYTDSRTGLNRCVAWEWMELLFPCLTCFSK